MNFIKRKIEKHKLKNTFKEYGYAIKKFDIEGIGTVEYAQWLHPFEKPKEVTKSNIDFYKRLSKNGGVIIDIGAHTGDTTVPMALAVGKNGLVLGLEPNKYVYKILEQNAKLNKNLTNIVPLCFAATENDGNFQFNYSDASFCNGGFLSQIRSKRHKHNFVLDVEGKNLQKFLNEEYGDCLSKLDLIKIDTEGYDKEIIKQMYQIIDKYKPNLMIECYKRLTVDERNELFDVVNSLDYNLYCLENFENFNKLKIIEKKNMFDRKHFEMLAIHKSKSIDV